MPEQPHEYSLFGLNFRITNLFGRVIGADREKACTAGEKRARALGYAIAHVKSTFFQRYHLEGIEQLP